MPRCESSAPRKKLPPPTTIATWTPVRTTSAICRAMVATTSGSTPSLPPPNTSPDSLRTTRRYGCPSSWTPEAATSPVSALDPCTITASSSLDVWTSPRQSASPGSAAADLEPGEALHGHAGRVQDGLDVLLAVQHRRLLEQGDVLEEAVDPPLHDLGQRLLRLALLAGGGLGDPTLVLDHVGRDLVPGDVLRAHRRHLHGSGPGRLEVLALELDKHAHLGGQVGGPAVHVGRHLTAVGAEHDHRGELDLLPDDRSHRVDVLGHGAPVRQRLRQQRGHLAGAGLRGVRHDVGGQLLELLVLGHEVGLAVQLDHGAVGGGHEPVGRAALGATLLDLGLALDAEQLGGLVLVAR